MAGCRLPLSYSRTSLLEHPHAGGEGLPTLEPELVMNLLRADSWWCGHYSEWSRFLPRPASASGLKLEPNWVFPFRPRLKRVRSSPLASERERVPPRAVTQLGQR